MFATCRLFRCAAGFGEPADEVPGDAPLPPADARLLPPPGLDECKERKRARVLTLSILIILIDRFIPLLCMLQFALASRLSPALISCLKPLVLIALLCF